MSTNTTEPTVVAGDDQPSATDLPTRRTAPRATKRVPVRRTTPTPEVAAPPAPVAEAAPVTVAPRRRGRPPRVAVELQAAESPKVEAPLVMEAKAAPAPFSPVASAIVPQPDPAEQPRPSNIASAPAGRVAAPPPAAVEPPRAERAPFAPSGDGDMPRSALNEQPRFERRGPNIQPTQAPRMAQAPAETPPSQPAPAPFQPQVAAPAPPPAQFKPAPPRMQQGANGADTNGRHAAPQAPQPPHPPTITVADLETKTADELREVARSIGMTGALRSNRYELVNRILQHQTEQLGQHHGEGVLEIIEDGFGFLRGERLLPGQDDIYVSQSQIRRFGLRTGDRVAGVVRPPKDNEKFFSMLRVESVNGVDPETARRRPDFEKLTPIFPLELIDLETTQNVLSTRLLNLVAPIGRGQRGLIVSPPKAGKTILLKSIANGITANYDDMHLMVCLIGERPEEVTDMRRSVDGEVISSTFDEPVEDHTKVAEMALERAKRLVEGGRDVVILLDSITRLARAYNLAVPPSGRTLSGGIDPVALYPPKRFFGAARNIEGGGSLTIIATCLIDTGSRMDDVIYEEFKGTGNMELHLDRKLAERRIYPSIDIQRSGTRREELLLDDQTLKQVWTMRRMVSMLGGTEGTELVLNRLSKTKSNPEFLLTLSKEL